MKGIDQKLEPGKFFFVQCKVRNVLECGLVRKLESLDLLYFENDSDPSPFTPKDVKVIGEIVGYRYKDEIADETVVFKPVS